MYKALIVKKKYQKIIYGLVILNVVRRHFEEL